MATARKQRPPVDYPKRWPKGCPFAPNAKPCSGGIQCQNQACNYPFCEA